MTTPTQTIRSGVNVDQLLGTIEAVKGQPDIARFQFRSRTKMGGRRALTH